MQWTSVLVAELCLTLWDPMRPQAPLSIGFSRLEYWNGLPFLSANFFPLSFIIFFFFFFHHIFHSLSFYFILSSLCYSLSFFSILPFYNLSYFSLPLLSLSLSPFLYPSLFPSLFFIPFHCSLIFLSSVLLLKIYVYIFLFFLSTIFLFLSLFSSLPHLTFSIFSPLSL